MLVRSWKGDGRCWIVVVLRREGAGAGTEFRSEVPVGNNNNKKQQEQKTTTGNVAEKKGAAVGDEDGSRDGRVLVAAGAGPEERSS